MSKKSLSKYCSIVKYLEHNHNDLFNVIEDLCLIGLFKPRGQNCITFLLPDKNYQKDIINSAYSTEPETAVAMIKSLILNNLYNNLSQFSITNPPMNLLNQKIEIEKISDDSVDLKCKLSIKYLKEGEKFEPLTRSNMRSNMNVMSLEGNGRIPLDSVVEEYRKEGGRRVKGGFCGIDRKNLHKSLEDKYLKQIGNKNNIYCVKVVMQLDYLNNKVNLEQLKQLKDFIGNDEISDSYLLDMFCNKHCSNCFSILSNALEQVSNYDNAYENYIKMRKQLLGDGTPNDKVNRNINFNKITSPIDIRKEVYDRYSDNKWRLSKDLFIIFCNLNKDIWMSDKFDAKDVFRNFSYLASNIFIDPSVLVHQEFDIAKDLTLYGNLLKSDVLLYEPQATFTSNEAIKTKGSIFPSPIEMKKFPLCYLINNLYNNYSVSGGSYEDGIASDLLSSYNNMSI